MRKRISIIMCCLLAIMIIQGTGIIASEEIKDDTKNDENVQVNEVNLGTPKGGDVSEEKTQENEVNLKNSTNDFNEAEIFTENNGVVLSANEADFPDANFREFVITKYDLNADGSLSQEEMSKVANLNMNDKKISDLNGIKLFTGLRSLTINKNSLTTLDVSGMQNLQSVIVNYNQLKSINASNNPKMTLLYASNNRIESVNVQNSPNLLELTLDDNLLTSINLDDNTLLTSITIRDNDLSTINLQNNVKLEHLTLPNNNLNEINLSKNIDLLSVTLTNFAGSKSTTRNALTKVDVSKNTKLKEYRIEQNHISEIDLSNNPDLRSVYLRNNLIKSADFSNNHQITQLYLSNNELREIKLNGIIGADSLFDFANNQLENINVASNTTLKTLDVSNNKLQNIDLKNNDNLTTLRIQENQLTKLDVSKNVNLQYLYLEENKVSSLDLSANQKLLRDYLGKQNVAKGKIQKSGNGYIFDFKQVVSQNELINVNVLNAVSYNAFSGIATFDTKPIDGIIQYTYDTKKYNLAVDIKANVAYTVSFDASNETLNDKIEVMEGDTILNFKTPQKKGFHFKGWFTDKECTTPWDFSMGVTQELNLYAKWEKINSSTQPGIIDAGDATKRYAYLTMLILAGIGIIITGNKLLTKK